MNRQKPINRKTSPQTESTLPNKTPMVFNGKLLLGIGFLILLVYFFVFERFFTNHNGKLGNDYSLFLPQLLDGAFWQHNNSIFDVAWFTPSFGGGLPNFPNPQSMFYSVPQFLFFIFDPVVSIKLTLLLFAIVGFYGFYILLTKVFQLAPITSLLGSTLFLFNGFYSHRMIVGHLTFHSYMLFPLFLFAVICGSKTTENIDFKNSIRRITLGALIFAYMIYTGALHIIPPLMLVTLVTLIFYKTINNNFKSGKALLRLFFILLFGIALSAAKLNAEISYLSLFPRDLYPLPGIPQFADLIKLCFNSLFGTVNEQAANTMTANKLIYLELHEYEYGITLIPIIIFLTGVLFFILKLRHQAFSSLVDSKLLSRISLIILLLWIPLLLNFYTPSWNGFLKSLPFIKNSATNIRWFSAYIPVVLILTCVCFEKVSFLNKHKNALALLGIVFVLFTNVLRNRKIYHNQVYDPKIIVDAYKDLHSGKLKPEITSIGMTALLGNGQVVERNDLFTTGASQINPYEPIFGYRLETFPIGDLKIGPVMEPNMYGKLNLKNPSSYVFPIENNSPPGTHFSLAQKESAEKFRKYQSFPFVMSMHQKIANYITLLSLCALITYALSLAYIGIRPYWK